MSTIKQQIVEPRIIEWGGDDPFTHTLIVGPTRCGKTSTILKPIIYQVLLARKRGIPVGLSVIEPKGDVARMVKEMAEKMGMRKDLVYIDPLYPHETQRINVMKGDKNDVAEATVAVLKSLFGKQEAFFSTVQELSSRKVTLLLKELYGDDMDIIDVLTNLRDSGLLQQNVEKLRSLQGTTDLVQFFDHELLGTGNMAEKYRQFIIGLRAQLENITSNEHLKAVVTGKSDIDLDEHFEKGNILAVNTALGKLGAAGDAFGMFIAMHLQLATFRRKGTEHTRVPHYLIIDEYSRYINPDVERFLSIAAEYRVALIAAIQSLGQLELESGKLSAKAMKKAILTSTRNKIIFGGLSSEDAKELSQELGKDIIKERVRTFDGGILANILPKMYKDQEVEKDRFHYTMLMDGLPRFHFVHKLLVNGTPQEPGIAVGEFVPRDWEQRELEKEAEVLYEKRPPFWKWRERAFYDVRYQRYLEMKERKQAIQEKLSVNPFDEFDINEAEYITQNNNTGIGALKERQEPLIKIKRPFTSEKKDKKQQENLQKENLKEVKVATTVEEPNRSSIIFTIGSKPKVENTARSINQAVIPQTFNSNSKENKQIHPQSTKPIAEMSNPFDDVEEEQPVDEVANITAEKNIQDNELVLTNPKSVQEDEFW